LLELAVGRRRIGKRITLSRPRTESLPADTGDCTELFAPFLLLTVPGDFLGGEVRVTVETEEVDAVVVASVSAEGDAAGAFDDEAMAVSAAA
jgi:hypothetical protein